jgi:hypothetical protein
MQTEAKATGCFAWALVIAVILTSFLFGFLVGRFV